MKGMRIIVLLLAVAPSVQAGDDVKQEIIDRCRATMSEYGAAMVKACADQDIEALVALNQYPESHQPLIRRCYGQMAEYGYAMVKACVDQDLEAEAALSNY